jgi:hypothetical protein
MPAGMRPLTRVSYTADHVSICNDGFVSIASSAAHFAGHHICHGGWSLSGQPRAPRAPAPDGDNDDNAHNKTHDDKRGGGDNAAFGVESHGRLFLEFTSLFSVKILGLEWNAIVKSPARAAAIDASLAKQ